MSRRKHNEEKNSATNDTDINDLPSLSIRRPVLVLVSTC
jgi:hypothetical protein